MGTLQDGLRKAGIASEKQLREAEAETQLRTEMETAQREQPLKEKEKRMGILQETSSPETFRKESRKLLLLYPDLVQELLNLAHSRGMQKKKDKGGRRLIANLYQVKEALQGKSDEEKKSVVNKLFSKT